MTFDIKPLTERHAEAAFLLATEVFASASTLHRALGIGLAEYRAYLRPDFDRMIAEDLSLVALAGNRKVQGCLIVTDFAGQMHERGSACPPFDALCNLTRILARAYSQKHPCRAGEVALVDMAAVADQASGQGLYKALRKAAEALARRKGFSRIVGELSSRATQHVVLGQMGHETVAEIAFNRFQHNGAYPFRGLTDPPSLILAEGCL